MARYMIRADTGMVCQIYPRPCANLNSSVRLTSLTQGLSNDFRDASGATLRIWIFISRESTNNYVITKKKSRTKNVFILNTIYYMEIFLVVEPQ